MTILDKIIENKGREVKISQSETSVEELKQMPYYHRKGLSLKDALLNKNGLGIIAEFKRKSPSKGLIHEDADINKITQGYTNAGAAGISVLTDLDFFGGSKEDLLKARAANPNTPLLRKDFMIDEYQLHEAKAWGADVILLIAANLSTVQISSLSQKAHEIGLEVLLEIHDKEELEASPLKHVDILGVNNRNLKNFAENNVNVSLQLFADLPPDIVKISESCISHPETVKQLKEVGYQGFLMGENFMKTENPAKTLKAFIEAIA